MRQNLCYGDAGNSRGGLRLTSGRRQRVALGSTRAGLFALVAFCRSLKRIFYGIRSVVYDGDWWLPLPHRLHCGMCRLVDGKVWTERREGGVSLASKKLTAEQIEEIRSLKKELEAAGKPFVYSKIGREYGVTGQTIRRNVDPSENDMKPRPPAKYNPESAKKRRASSRAYQFYAYKNSETDRQIIAKLDSLDNKQRYIKGLIIRDIAEENAGATGKKKKKK